MLKNNSENISSAEQVELAKLNQGGFYRYKIKLEYIGTNYAGWQRQKTHLSLQQVVEEAIFELTKEKVVVHIAGRTDAGVHAIAQVAHFDLKTHFNPQTMMYSINHFMRKHTIGIIDIEEVDSNFHARFSAKSRHYVYKILNRKAVNILNKNFVYWVRYKLDLAAMEEASKHLLGEHDFSTFRAADCQAKSPIKTIDKIEFIVNGDIIEIHISAMSFLHHMVRNIVGSLVLVGSNKWQPLDMKKALEAKKRAAGGPTAPPQGLYFVRVNY